MPSYTVDVKAFINVTVEAESEAAARAAANEFVELLSPCSAYVTGYTGTQRAENQSAIVTDAGGFDIDGESEAEEEGAGYPDCVHCGEEMANGNKCPSCNGLN